MIKNLLFTLSIGLVFCGAAYAQEVDVSNYNINVRVDVAASALEAQATLDLINPTDVPRSKLYFRLTRLGKVSQVSIDGSPVQSDTSQDHRTSALNQIAVTPSSPLVPGGHIKVSISYRIQVADATPLIAIYPGEVLLAPESVWVPAPSTEFAIYGPNTAPFTLNVTLSGAPNSFQVASSGISQAGGSSTFVQSLNSLPLVVAGPFNPPITSEHAGIKIALYVQPGIASAVADQTGGEAGTDGARNSATGTDQSGRILAEIGQIVDFFTKTFGPAPAGASFNVISSVHAGNTATAGAVILNEQIFREDFLDAVTIQTLADAVARIWTDGRVRLRGQDSRTAEADHPAQRAHSAALLRDSIPRYLSVLYLGERFGEQAASDAFGRLRAAYTPVAQSHRDTELSVQSFVIPSYGDAVFAKGPLILRLLAHLIGTDKLIQAIKTVTAGPQTKFVTPQDFHEALGGGTVVDTWFRQWVDSLVEPDIIIGIPMASEKPGAQQVNLRNLGTGDVSVTVLAVTASGKKITEQCVVPSEDLTSVDIPTTEKIVSVEADPEKYIVQTNYDNDSRPVKLSTASLLNAAIVAFNAKKFGEADSNLTEAVKGDPNNPLLHAWLGRVLMSEGRADQAHGEAEAAIKIKPPIAPALTWAHITLGQIALAKNAPGDAVENLRRAVLEVTEEPAEYVAREALINAEKASGKLAPVDPSIKSFIAQFDAMASKQTSSDKVFTMVMKGTLKKFGDGFVLTPAQSWNTEILRAERIDSNRVALDVALKVRSGDRDQSGTALLILYRGTGAWMLENVRLFNVK